MGLREAAIAAKKRADDRKAPCHVALAIAALDAEKVADLMDLLNDRGMTSSAISVALMEDAGIEVASSSIARHRRAMFGLDGGCKCPR